MVSKEAYLQVYQPLTIRKTLLSSAIDCIKLIEDKESIVSLIKNKHHKIIEVKRLFNDLKEDYAKLEAALPELSSASEIKEAKSKAKIKIQEPIELNLNNIEKEIMDIKQRIEKLN